MRRIWLCCSVLAAACASGGAPDGAHFARGVGLGTAGETVEKAHRVLALHQFEIYQEEQAPNIYIETRWRDRMPFEDEQALGITDAQVRAMVRARPRSGTSQMGDVYTVDMIVQQRVRLMGNDEWTNHTITTDARQFAERIAEDLRRELNVGVRRFGRSEPAPRPL